MTWSLLFLLPSHQAKAEDDEKSRIPANNSVQQTDLDVAKNSIECTNENRTQIKSACDKITSCVSATQLSSLDPEIDNAHPRPVIPEKAKTESDSRCYQLNFQRKGQLPSTKSERSQKLDQHVASVPNGHAPDYQSCNGNHKKPVTHDEPDHEGDNGGTMLMWALTGFALAFALVWMGKKFKEMWDMQVEMMLRYPDGPPPS